MATDAFIWLIVPPAGTWHVAHATPLLPRLASFQSFSPSARCAAPPPGASRRLVEEASPEVTLAEAGMAAFVRDHASQNLGRDGVG